MVLDLYSIVNGEKAVARRKIDADLDLERQQMLTAANTQRAGRMATQMPTVAGGSRYRRRSTWTPGMGASGLEKANTEALIAARKKAAYAGLDEKHAARGLTMSLGTPFRV